MIVRENVEGLYAGRHGGSRVEGEVAADTSIVTRAGTRRIAETAFALAEAARGARTEAAAARHLRRQGERARLVRLLPRGRVRGRLTASDVAFEAVYVDAAALYLVQRPSTFDVVVAENMFGDILSDLGAGTVGGLGLAPSADVGDAHGLFQAAHGSAPDIAGKGIANPLATILSAGMMLDWLGRRREDEAALRASGWVEEAVAASLLDGSGLTGDVGGSAGTVEAGDAVLRALDAVAAAA